MDAPVLQLLSTKAVAKHGCPLTWVPRNLVEQVLMPDKDKLILFPDPWFWKIGRGNISTKDLIRYAAISGSEEVFRLVYENWGERCFLGSLQDAAQCAAYAGKGNIIRIIHDDYPRAALWGVLQAAASAGHYEIVEMCVREWEDEISLDELESAFCRAIEGGHMDIVEFIEGYWRTTMPTIGNAVYIAADKGYTDVVRSLKIYNWTRPTKGVFFGDCSYLANVAIRASYGGHYELVKECLNEWMDKEELVSPLIAIGASYSNCTEILELYKERKFRFTNLTMMDMLDACAEQGSEEALSFILETWSVSSSSIHSAFRVSCYHARLGIVERLLDYMDWKGFACKATIRMGIEATRSSEILDLLLNGRNWDEMAVVLRVARGQWRDSEPITKWIKKNRIPCQFSICRCNKYAECVSAHASKFVCSNHVRFPTCQAKTKAGAQCDNIATKEINNELLCKTHHSMAMKRMSDASVSIFEQERLT